MKTIKERIHTYLSEEPRARLRVNRFRTIANLIIEENGLPTSKESLIDALHSAESINRIIRQVQQENPELRDFTDKEDTKEILEQSKMLDLGYQPGFRELVR